MDFRQAARDAALKAGFFPAMFEHWAASGRRAPLEACLDAVRGCDLLVVIVAHRYGWVPDSERLSGYRSITWLECEAAIRAGREVLAFMLDEKCSWPIELKEEYAAIEAVRKGVPTPEELLSIRRGIQELVKFKAWLSSLGVRARFNSSSDLRGEVIAALNDWRLRRTDFAQLAENDAEDPSRYLRNLHEICRYIDIRGLQVGSGKAHRFPIEELYIPIEFRANIASSSRNTSEIPAQQLKAILERRCSVIIGNPGSGKTTLLRRIVFNLTASWLRVNSVPLPDELNTQDEVPLPILVRLSDLSMFVERSAANPSADIPTEADSVNWLIRFLGKMSAENSLGLSETWFRKLLEDGRGIVLIDGLDEAPTLQSRKTMARLVENCARVYTNCHFVVTSRPKAYTAETTLYAFEPFEVQPLGESAVNLFLSRWCEALFPEETPLRERHFAELQFALQSRPDIRRMATNPVMLTALATVHWNARRIPEQRAELYESIVLWLARARESRKGRTSAERCINLLQAIALAMQNSSEGRLVEMNRRGAAEQIASRFEDGGSSVEAAERFLIEEELDSGIVVGRGDNLRFWHLSFQEFLAARAAAGLREQDQDELFFSDLSKTLSSEWRETLLLFSGILYHQGPEKLDAFVSHFLGHSRDSTLARKAKLVGLIGSIQRDLASFHYKFQDPRFEEMRGSVMSVFEHTGIQVLEPAARLEAAEAIGQSGDPRLDEPHWIEMSSGTFLIGAQSDDPEAIGYDPCALRNEGPCAMVAVQKFRISRFPVTVAEFENFIADDGYDHSKYWKNDGFGRWKRPEQWDAQLQYPNRPVVGVSWYEAQAYCRWSGYGVRLPTGIQWERAARGIQSRLFPWGDEQPNDTLLNYASALSSNKEERSRTYVGRPTPVGFYPTGATPDGVMDMAGNVFEWCQDEIEVSFRLVRGGGYNSVSLFVRAAFKGRYEAGTRRDFIGFRICSTPL
jgi:formylglycine-generating enzyme required for sulfatase activity